MQLIVNASPEYEEACLFSEFDVVNGDWCCKLDHKKCDLEETRSRLQYGYTVCRNLQRSRMI